MWNFVTLIFVCAFSAKEVLSYDRPNVIFFVADDLGWNDLSFHGSKQIPTPHLDSLAHDGIILNNYYVCPICSPSRGALMTGFYPIHTGLQHGVIHASNPYGLPLKFPLMPEWFQNLNYKTHAVGKHDVIYSDQPWGLPLSKTLLPQYLRKLGYATHAIGKWHLGFFRKEYTPTYRGFDSHYGYWGGKEDYFDHTQDINGLWGLDFHHNMKSLTHLLGNYSTFLFADRAVDVIKSHNTSQPLFLYVAFQAVHSANIYAPLQAPEDYIKKFSYIEDKKRRVFAAMVSAMDDSIEQIKTALESRGLLKNSILVFTTDNGGPADGFNDNAASNWPLRGVKATLWEGGVRGIAFVWSPLIPKSQRGKVSMDLMHISDWLPTLYSAAGGNVSALGSMDGHDQWATLTLGHPSSRKEVLINIDPVGHTAALRMNSYKIIQGDSYGGAWNGWYGPPGPDIFNCGPRPVNASTECQPGVKPCLFDVKNDPCEFHNLAEKKPEILALLKKRLLEYNATAVPPANKPMDPASNPKFHNYQWVNWMDMGIESNYI